jgi:4-amino-4-deoxy-L-arabinose transferase-like glycosyltransferase
MAADAEPGSGAGHVGLGLAAILAVALAVRVVAWWRTAVMFNDGPIFLAMAEAIAQGRWADVLVHPYHPLYPALIALLGVFPIHLETAAVMVSILGGLLSVAAIFWFVRDAFGVDVAWLAAWVVALHPWAVDFSADVMSDGLYMGFFLVGFVAMARMVEHPTAPNTLACGITSGLAYLVRPEGAGLLVACVLLLAARGLFDRTQRGRLALSCVGLLLAAAVVMAPFVVAVGQQTGEFVLTQKKSVSSLVGAAPLVRTEVEQEHEHRASLRVSTPLPLPESAIRSDGEGASRPSRNLSGFLEAILRVTTTSMAAIRFELMAFALLGLWSLGSNRKPTREWTIGLPIVLHSGLLVLLVWGAGYVSRRHALAPWLPVVGFAALGWRFLCTAIAARDRARGGALLARLRTPRAINIALVVLLMMGWGARDLRPRRLDRAPVRVAAEWLAENHPDSGSVAAQKLRTAYYAGATFVPLPSGRDGHLADHLRRRAARWIVIDDAKLADHQGLEAGIGRWLERIYVVSSEGRSVSIFSVEFEPAG